MLKRMTFLMLILLIFFGCAKKSTEPNENNVLDLVASVPTVGNPLDVDASDAFAFIADDQGSLVEVDLSDYSSKWITSVPSSDGTNRVFGQIRKVSFIPTLHRLFINDIGGSDLIRELDTSNPDSLKELNYYTGATSSMQDMKFQAIVSADTLFKYEGVFIGGAEIKYGKYGYHDIAYPPNFSITLTITPPFRPRGFDLNADNIFVAVEQRGLMIYDRAGALVGQCDLPGEAQKVKVVGNYAYLACRQSGLQIVDISVPSAPVKVSSIDTNGYATALDVWGNYAAVSSGGSGIYLFDITSPLNPVLLENLTSCGYTNNVKHRGNKLLVAARDQGLLVYTVNN